MGLESATFVSDLVSTNPPGTDLRSQGDDHLRLIKAVLKATFPNAAKAFFFPTTVVKTANYTIQATDMNTVIRVDTSSGVVNFTLPTLIAADAGWEISIFKINVGANPYYIVPASGTIQSGAIAGLAKTRRCIPGTRTRVFWTGSIWIAERVSAAPLGSIVPFAGTSLPIGFEWPNGQTLPATDYPDYVAIRGSGSTPDVRGRLMAGKDDMGGVAAGRLTGLLPGGVTGTTFEAAGGAEGHQIGVTQIPPHTHGLSISVNINDPGHSHGFTAMVSGNGSYAGASGSGAIGPTSQNTAPNTTGITASATGSTDSGPGTSVSHNNVQPTIIENLILVVE